MEIKDTMKLCVILTSTAIGLGLSGCDAMLKSEPTIALRNQGQLSVQADAAFQNAFTGEPQCKGLKLINGGESRADFVVTWKQSADGDGSWDWFLSWPHDPGTGSAKGIGGYGNQPTAEKAVRDVCLTVWDDLHKPYPDKPGGRVE